MITDPQHLDRVIDQAHQDLDQLAHQWRQEDADACAPRSGIAIATSGGTPSKPVEATALGTRPYNPTNPHEPPIDHTKYRDRDRLGNQILRITTSIRQTLERRQSRHAGGNCTCCNTNTATHGHDRRNRPTHCYDCWMFQRRMGYPCDDTTHTLRPRTRMCDCPPDCCPPGTCTDRAAADRSLSERCRKRGNRQRKSA